MSSPESPASVVVDPADFRWNDEDGPAAQVRRVVAAATRADGQSPLDEQALLSLRHEGLTGSTLRVGHRPGDRDATGFALVRGRAEDGEVDLALVVHPDARRRGVGSALAREALAALPETVRVTAWSHGNHPAAAVLARRLGLARVRDLWVMRRSLSDPPLPSAPEHDGDGPTYRVRTFRPGQDEDALLAVNAAAFAGHPEQGRMSRADLEHRISEPWFDPDGIFLAESSDGDLLGFHWTKVHPAEGDVPARGEVYVVGIAPDAQGLGLGRSLTLAGLHHLASRGLDEVILYVEADNAPAVAVYRRLGFDHAPDDTHVMYERAVSAARS